MLIKANGPAIWGGCVTRRQHRSGSWYPAPAGPESCHGARRVWRTFCHHGTNFNGCRCGRGTSLTNGRVFLPVQKFDKWALAQCRGAKLSRRQNLVKVQDFNCVQMRVSGCHGHYKYVLSAGAKAKSVTNNLPILSVL